MSDLDVTFIVQNRNYGCYLPDCLESIKAQKGLDDIEYEIIGLDAGSTDNSREIYERLIGGFVDATGMNQAEALNKALKLAKGKYIGWINSDDFYRHNFLKHHLSFFKKLDERFQNKVSVTSSVAMFLKQSSLFRMKVKLGSSYYIMRNLFNRDRLSVLRDRKLTPDNLHIYQPATLIDCNWLKCVGGWNEQLTYVIDLELWYRLAIVSYIGFIPKITTIIRRHDRNIGVVKHDEEEQEAILIRKRYEKAKFLGVADICKKSISSRLCMEPLKYGS